MSITKRYSIRAYDRRVTFATLEEAQAAAERVWQAHGIITEIQELPA